MSCFTKWEFNLKQHQIELAKSSARETLERKKDKRITSNKHTRHGWFVLPRFGPRRPSPRWGVHLRTGLFQPFPSLHRSHKDRRALLFLLKDHSRSHKDHHTLWCLLLAFTSLQNFGGSWMGVNTPRTNEHKDVAHTISQWISQGTSAKLKWVALFCLLSLLWHLCWF
jgi:hypothetical protein